MGTGIRLLKVDYDLSSLVKTAGFRIESLNLDKIVNDVLTKYIPTQPQDKRDELIKSWLIFKERLENLPKKWHPQMNLFDLSGNVAVLPVNQDIEEWENKNDEPAPIVGSIIPPEVEVGNFRLEAVVGLDACVWTTSHAD